MKAVLLALVAVLALAGCEPSDATPRRTIYASLYPLQYVAQRIAGDHFEVVNLTKPGQEPHDTELSLRRTAELSEAALVVYDKGLAGAIDDGVAAADPDHVVDARALSHSGEDDPHVWLSPDNMATIGRAIEQQLAEIDPARKADYEKNLRSLESDLMGLTADYRSGLEECAITTVVVSHDAYRNLPTPFTWAPINGLSPEAEPSPAHIAELRQLIERTHITTVFSEELASPEMALSLAADLGLRTEVLDPIEGLSEKTSSEDYLSLMRQNLTKLQEANQCKS